MMVFHIPPPPPTKHTAVSQPCQLAQTATTTSTGGKHLLKGRVQNGQKELRLCKGTAKKNDTTLPKQVQRPDDFSMTLSEINCFFTKAGENVRTFQTSVFQSHCYHSCHQNSRVCTQKAVCAKERADTSLEL